MARVRNTFWKKILDSLVQSENIPVVFKQYINFGTAGGESGYGFRSNTGVIEFKNESGEWVSLGGGTVIADTFGITVDGATIELTAGSKGFRYIEQDCTITGWSVLADQTGSIVFDVKRAGVSLAGTEKPTLSAASSASDLSLSTWTTPLVAGDIIEFIIDSASTVTRATLTVLITKI